LGQQRVLLIVGATASGKSALAVALARRLGGEIVSADAMAVYKGMDIGTAKPSADELAAAPHHLISCIEPEERCDVSRWLALADAAVKDIQARGKTAIIAGGSPLYCKAFIEGLSAGVPRDEGLREKLSQRYEAEGSEALFAELQRVDPAYAAQRHANDQRRIVRALEVFHATGKPYSSFHVTDGVERADFKTLMLGISWDKEILHQRINKRCRDMFARGLVEEVRRLEPRLSPEAKQAVGYKEVLGHLRGDYDLDRAEYLVQRNSRHLAKHQMTWYRRFRQIRWLRGDDPNLADAACLQAQRAEIS
jgi:tRNA dimethylallyltransferase